MKLNYGIKVLQFGIEKIWKMFFENVWEPMMLLHEQILSFTKLCDPLELNKQNSAIYLLVYVAFNQQVQKNLPLGKCFFVNQFF